MPYNFLTASRAVDLLLSVLHLDISWRSDTIQVKVFSHETKIGNYSIVCFGGNPLKYTLYIDYNICFLGMVLVLCFVVEVVFRIGFQCWVLLGFMVWCCGWVSWWVSCLGFGVGFWGQVSWSGFMVRFFSWVSWSGFVVRFCGWGSWSGFMVRFHVGVGFCGQVSWSDIKVRFQCQVLGLGFRVRFPSTPTHMQLHPGVRLWVWVSWLGWRSIS